SATNITTPTYIIHGLADLSISPDSADIILAALPISTLNDIWKTPGRDHVESYLESNYFTNVADFIVTIFA
ncbi:MAG: hypothetical protein ACTSSK_09600, partial [Candidatus Heimdallarchaeota archaeon]